MSLATARSRLASLSLLAIAVLIAAITYTRAQPQTPPAGVTLYVDWNVPPGGTGDGSNWANAISSLDAAIAMAPSGAHLWVAEGVYAPANQTTGFLITKPLKLFGGFYGDESSLQARHGSFQQTILEGDRAGDDPLSYTDNAFHVVSIDGVIGTSTGPGVRIDGFRIAHGLAGTALGLDGAGIWSHCSDLDLANCSLDHNYAHDGGAIWFTGGCYEPADPEFSNPGTQLSNTPNFLHISTCEFFDNHADHRGGALFGQRLDGWVMNTKFLTNKSDPYGLGGAVFLWRMRTADHFDFTNCVFWENYCKGTFRKGGAMLLDEYSASPGEATQSNIVNCTFAGNWADWDVNQVCPDGQAIVVSSNSTVGIYNSILWWNHNLAQGQCTASLPIAGPAVVTYSDVEFGWGGVGSNNISANPLFTAGSPPPTSFVGGSPPPNSVLPLLVLRKASTTARGSQCIDAADYDRLPSDVADLDDDGDYVEVTPLDLLDSSRFVDRHNFGEDPNQGTGSSGVDYTDMGAYERTWP